jgi:toxin-antitoxin system PIN domain toxin
MIAVDTNILIYAHRADAPFHQSASQCIATLAEGRVPWAIPWTCLHEFVGVVTRPKVFQPPSSLDDALAQVDVWLGSPSLALLAEGGNHWVELQAILRTSRVVGSQVHDARIAAVCLAHGVRELWTADRDFGRFPGLVVRNPLVSDVVRERASSSRRRASVRG